MSVPPPAAPDPAKPQPTEPRAATASPAGPRTASLSVLPISFRVQTQERGHAEHNWKQAWGRMPLALQGVLQAKCSPDKIPEWLDRAWTSRCSRLTIQASLGVLSPLFPPLPEGWAKQYEAMLCDLEWESTPADPRQDWRFLAATQPDWKPEPAESKHPALEIPPGPQVWLVWTSFSSRDAQPEPALILCATADAPRRGETLRVWHRGTGWERTLTITEDTLHMEDPEDPDLLALARLLHHQSRVFQETPPEGA